MTSPINDFQDILNDIERDPALRDALRRHILTEELLQVPVRLERIEEDITGLKKGQDRLEEKVDGLGQKVDRLEEKHDRLEIWPETPILPKQSFSYRRLSVKQSVLKRNTCSIMPYMTGIRLLGIAQNPADGFPARLLEAKVDSMSDDIDTLKDNVGRMGGDVSRLTGTDYESHVATYVHRFLRRSLGINATAFSTQRDKSALTALLDEAEAHGIIDAQETDDLNLADLVLTSDGPTDYILAEVSITVQQDDIDRAAERARLLTKATARTVNPFAIGVREQPHLRREHVQVILIPEAQIP